MDEAEAPTVGERAYRDIRHDILRGALAPGAKLKLDQLRAAYGASTTILRELLNRLVSEKLVLAEGQRGFEVMPISAAHLREIADLRLLVEREALRLSFAKGDAAWQGQVEEAYRALAAAEAAEPGDRAARTELWLTFDWRFHRALIAACGSHTLLEAHATVTERYLRYQILTLRACDPLTVQEHRDLNAAAQARDVASAETLIAAHIARGVTRALQSGLLR